ncbi:TPA: outer membrane protein transport protein [Vibrio cholerae]|uniref:Long-chain fatty acid transport protein n=1 Tax=Vibrio cholerae serotype O1 (strain ATCC 39541 / Classical Ogawa 395 / O395) TaxID=345073 RepID=A0A0H3AN28_VIBC3|nr:outer membrane protein transport protein [Vibrio cholerae]ABQ21811.1 long-chain fatty acid transport protein [Vibrio cholerae O395]ACP09068.1 long-chain fatty acid transport protein [Vibrio cholerae O395]EEY43041.1 long-chain fatty acid transport protein [Vibrio cholerae RC27]EGR0473830.1 aromatic hydrocarbon degradation protein [Vibrio cholerae]EGR2410253.1 aromatic hydrocarbon degradation protein [Vibrio cholerae]
MKTNKTLLSCAVAFGLASVSTFTQAAGFQLAEYSATGLGRAYAGEAAMADNASAQWRNPAMLTYLEGTQVSAGAIYVNPNVDVEGTVNHAQLGKTHASSNDFAHDAVIPNFYLSHHLNEQVALGFALGTNYGMETDLGTEFAASHFGSQASVISKEANLNIAYQILPQLSIGGGVRYVMGEGHFGATAPAKNLIRHPITNNVMTLPKGTTLKYMEGEDNSWGWQVGSAWQINQDHRVGFAYKSEVVMDFEGHAEGVSYGSYKPGMMSVTLPATAELASFHQLNDQWAIHASINWTDWSSFKELTAVFPEKSDLIKSENWEDNYRFALGTTYQYDAKLALRAGVAYDTSAVDDKNRTATIPETDRTWVSVGGSYVATPQLTLDAGFTYIFAKDATINEPRDASDQTAAAIGGAFTGNVSGNVWLIGVQANYRF